MENLRKLLVAYGDCCITKAEFNAKLDHYITLGEFTREQAEEYINSWVDNIDAEFAQVF